MFIIYGTSATEVDEQNKGVDSKQEYVEGQEIIHQTGNEEEARSIMAAGGFIKDGVWKVATKCIRSDENTPGSKHKVDQPLKKGSI